MGCKMMQVSIHAGWNGTKIEIPLYYIILYYIILYNIILYSYIIYDTCDGPHYNTICRLDQIHVDGAEFSSQVLSDGHLTWSETLAVEMIDLPKNLDGVRFRPI